MRHILSEVILKAYETCLEQGLLTCRPERLPQTEPCRDLKHGDFASNIAMVMSKLEKKSPRDVATPLAEALRLQTEVFDSIDVAGPGFLNMRLSPTFFSRVLRDTLEQGEGAHRSGRHGRKALIEFVSANPTGPLHLGHARGAYVGDACARLLDAAGYDVEREFYVNDAGNQIRILAETVFVRYQQLFGESVELSEGQYPAEYVIDIAKIVKEQHGDALLTMTSEERMPICRAAAIEHNLGLIKKTLGRAGISFDQFFSEQEGLHDQGLVDAVVERYRAKDAVYQAERARETEGSKRRAGSKAAQFKAEQKGGLFLETSRHGDEEDRIILRHDGSPVYLTADLAYHASKFDRGYDKIIDVFGADHGGHVPRIRAGMHLLGFDGDQLDFVLVQIVKLLRDGTELKLSKRSGTVYALEDMIEELGADATRFIFLMRSPNAQFDFDVADVLRDSNDNPVYYCQMGHARAANVLKKAASEGQPFGGLATCDDSTLNRLVLPEEREMIKMIADLNRVVVDAAEALEPQRLLHFAKELIALFHGYFSKYKATERIISDDQELTQARLALVSALKQALKSALGCLGIDAPDWMGKGDRT